MLRRPVAKKLKLRPPVPQKLVDETGAPKALKKAWDGQDKDAFFRDKYAHVHAKQFRTPPKNTDPKKSAARPNLPRPDFAQRFKHHQDPSTEQLFGKNPVLAALEKRHVLKVYTGLSAEEIDETLLEKCKSLDIGLQMNTPLQHLEIMANHGVHNKYVATVKKREYPEFDPDLIPKRRDNAHPVGVYVDQVTDTHNFGAILRCAYWLGADFVAFSKRNCAPMSPQVIKSSAGAAEFLPIFTVNSPLKLLETLNSTWNIVATLPKSKSVTLAAVEADNLKSLRDKPCLLIVGSEDEGIRTSIAQRCTHSSVIPTVRNNPLVDSLNVSVATALLLEKF